MRELLHRVHIWLGIIVSVPVLAWAVSGFLYALPNAVEGGTVEVIDPARVKVSPLDALGKANELANRELPITALTLLTRNGAPHYQAIGGMGADSILINAETGSVLKTPPPGAATRFFRQAHFYFFAGSWQVILLILFSCLAALSAITGIYLNVAYWLAPSRGRSGTKGTLGEM